MYRQQLHLAVYILLSNFVALSRCSSPWTIQACVPPTLLSDILEAAREPTHSVESCISLCDNQSHDAAAVVNNNTCWCGHSELVSECVDGTSNVDYYVRPKSLSVQRRNALHHRRARAIASLNGTSSGAFENIKNSIERTSSPAAARVESRAGCSSFSGKAKPSDPYWLENIKHQGTAPFHNTSLGYAVFRNVKAYGAKGDGKTDDTAAINAAILAGNRCAVDCQSTTSSPATVYFPQGTYLVSSPILAIYQTTLVGDARHPPKLLASPRFTGKFVIDANPTGAKGQYYISQNSFFRNVRNFYIDLTAVPASNYVVGVHWLVSQATALTNIVVTMSQDPNTKQQGLFMEGGSGGFMSDLVFIGGQQAMWVGNQQFTVRNLTISNAQTAIFQNWDWQWTYTQLTIKNCRIGFDIKATDSGSDTIIDATVINTPIFIRTNAASTTARPFSLVLNNVNLNNVPVVVQAAGKTVLSGTSKTSTIQSWVQGNVYSGTQKTPRFTQASVSTFAQNSVLLDRGTGKVFGRKRPHYESFAASQFISVKSNGAAGDGATDDTAALQSVINKAAGCQIVFVDAGIYVVTSTLFLPSGTRMIGEGWSMITSRGDAFSDESNPTPVIKVGNSGQKGTIQITDIVFSTMGPAAGAIIMEWNMGAASQGSAAMWESHFIIGGWRGSKRESYNCGRDTRLRECDAAFLGLHLTKSSSAYLEGTWVWTADHDADDYTIPQITQFSGRGVLSESQGPVWMIGTASEHHAIYQYNLVGARNHFMGTIQTETPYYQPVPSAPEPFALSSQYKDPTFSSDQKSAWALHITNSAGIYVFGAGLYSFFNNYTTTCHDSLTCNYGLVNIASSSQVRIAGLNTVGAQFSLNLDGSPIINANQNANGYEDTVAFFTL